MCRLDGPRRTPIFGVAVVVFALIASVLPPTAGAGAVDEHVLPDAPVVTQQPSIMQQVLAVATGTAGNVTQICEPAPVIGGALQSEITNGIGRAGIAAGVVWLLAGGVFVVGAGAILLGAAILWANYDPVPGGINQVGNDCIRPLGERPLCGFGEDCASTAGHPNLVTFDGLAYTFHGAGDYLLSASPDGDIEIQVRYSRFDNMRRVSYNRAIAARIGGATVAVGDAPDLGPFDRAPVTVDGEELSLGYGDEYELPRGRIRRTALAWIVEDDTGMGFSVGEFVGSPISVRAADRYRGDIAGLFGDADGDAADDAASADGTIIDMTDFDQLYGEFGAGWLRAWPEASLFETEPHAVDDLPVVPSAALFLADFDADAQREAERVCRAGGLEPGAGLAECMVDVLLTGDPRWANATAPVADVFRRGTPAALVQASAVSDAVDPTAISLDEPVSPGTPAAGAGRIDGRLEVDHYALEVAESMRLSLSSLEPCGDGSPVTLTARVVDETGAQLAVRSLADCGHGRPFDVRPGSVYVSVTDPGGGTPEYSFAVVEAPVIDNGMLVLDEAVATTSTAPGELQVWTVDLSAGTALFFDSRGGDCRARWSLVDDGDVPVAGGAACLDHGPFVVADSGPHVLELAMPVPDTASFVLTVVAEGGGGLILAGRLVEGELRTPGQADRFTFLAASGSRVVLSADDFDNDCAVRWTILGPVRSGRPDRADADPVFSGAACLDTDPIDLTQAGEYQLVIEATGDHVGPYQVRMTMPAEAASSSTAFGVTQRGSFETPGDEARFDITVSERPQILLSDPDDVNSCSMRWRVLSPDGSSLADVPSCLDTDPIDLPGLGAYTVVVDPDAAEVGAWAITIWQVPAPQVFPVELNRNVAGDFTVPGAVAALEFEAPPSGRILLSDPDDVNACEVRWRIVSAAGTEVVELPACLDTDPIALSAAGGYTLFVDPDRAAVGPWTTTIWTVRPAEVRDLEFGAAYEGEFTRPGDRVEFEFSARGGDTLSLGQGDGDNDCAMRWRIEGIGGDPDLAPVFDAAACIDADAVVMPADGDYTLVIDPATATIGPWSLIVRRAG